MCAQLLCCPKIVPPVSQEKVVNAKILRHLSSLYYIQTVFRFLLQQSFIRKRKIFPLSYNDMIEDLNPQ